MVCLPYPGPSVNKVHVISPSLHEVLIDSWWSTQRHSKQAKDSLNFDIGTPTCAHDLFIPNTHHQRHEVLRGHRLVACSNFLR